MTQFRKIGGKGSKALGEKTRQRSEHLFEVAKQLISDRGYDRISVNELAEMASISVGGLYRYIGTKTDLLAMICDEINRGASEEMTKAADQHSLYSEKLKAAYAVYWDWVWEYASSILVAYREFIHFPDEVKKQHTKEQAEIVAMLNDLIRAGIKAGEFANVDAYAVSVQMLMLSHIRVLKGWALHGYDKQQLLDQNLQMVMALLRRD